MGRRQQAIDKGLVGVGRDVGEERVDLCGRGGSPIRFRVNRRIKVARLARGAGARRSVSSRAIT